MELLGWVWFTSRATVGIVVCKNEVEEKAYIAGVSGHNENADINDIMNWGAKFPLEEAISLINRSGTWKKRPTTGAPKTEPEKRKFAPGPAVSPEREATGREMSPFDRLNQMMDDPTFLEDFADYISIKKEIEDAHENRILRLLHAQKDDTVHDFIIKILKWEEKWEEMKYSKHFVQTESNIFAALTRLLMKMGTPLDVDGANSETFLASGFTWEDFTFKIYIGQGAFVRVMYKEEQIFQST